MCVELQALFSMGCPGCISTVFQLCLAREFDTFPNEKQRISRMNAYIFLSNLLFLYIGFFGFLCYNGIEVKKIEGQYIKIKKR